MPFESTKFSAWRFVAAAADIMPPRTRNTSILRAFGAAKVPMIAFVGPVVERLDPDVAEIRIPLSWRTKNHLSSMYVGALVLGADCAAGLRAGEEIVARGAPVALSFKDLTASFKKRAMADVLFRCRDGLVIAEAVERAVVTAERTNLPVLVEATCPSIDPLDVVARFELTLSLKRRDV